jgi:DNA-binding transcriptional LysR family regulator
MEFKQLEMFVAVAQLRSVSRAAERVFRTQQAVSMAITKLEYEVGERLFYRRPPRQFELTATGKILWEHAYGLLQLRDQALRSLRLGGEKASTAEAQSTQREAEC